MKPLNILLLICLMAFVCCHQQTKKNDAAHNPKEAAIQTVKNINPLETWARVINKNTIDSIENMYALDATKIISTDSILNSSGKITSYYYEFKEKIISIESIFKIEANKDRGIEYELIKFKTENSQEYIQIVIWKLDRGMKVRDFEFTSKVNINQVNLEEITSRRNLWIKLCNTNNAKNLITELYTKNTLYFNHKPLVKGTEQLVKEYDYMNNPDYSLMLHPLEVIPVNDSIVYEIGQCKGSYNGKYILIWKKELDGNWKIFIDSNV